MSRIDVTIAWPQGQAEAYRHLPSTISGSQRPGAVKNMISLRRLEHTEIQMPRIAVVEHRIPRQETVVTGLP